MSEYYSDIKKSGMTLGLTTGFLWLAAGVLGVYFSKGDLLLLLSALMVGGLPVLITFIASKFNIAGSLLLILEAGLVMLAAYLESSNLLIIILFFLSYGLPLIFSSIMFIRYWYKKKTRI